MTFLPRYWSRQMTMSQITTTLPHYAKDSRRHSINTKKTGKHLLKTTDPFASFLWSLNFMKETCTIKLMNTSKITFPLPIWVQKRS